MDLVEPMIQILLINLLLSGDNAIVIAMASRNLPKELQGKAIQWGTIGAIGLRIFFVFIMIHLLELPYIHFIGGLLLLYIAYKLMVDNPESKNIKSGESLKEAIFIIIFADIIMSFDNVLAITAIAESNMLLIIAGILLSFPIILTASEWILHLMQKYPGIIFIGAGLLAWTGGKMILKEKFIILLLQSFHISNFLFLLFTTIFILVIGITRRGLNGKE